MAKESVDASNKAGKTGHEDQIRKHLQVIESLDGVIITPYQRGKTELEGGFTGLIRGNLHGGGKGKLKIEIYPDVNEKGKLSAFLYNMSENPEGKEPSEAVHSFATLAGTRFQEVAPAFFDNN